MSEAPTIDKRAIGLLAEAIASELWARVIDDSQDRAPNSVPRAVSTPGNRTAMARGEAAG